MGKGISIREEYLKYGVDEYYKNSDYHINPHLIQIEELLIRNLGKIVLGNVLDMCAGGGEVTNILLSNNIDCIMGSDKYTEEEYVKNTHKECINLSFNDILAGKLSEHYSTIICSFGLHLVNKKDLKMLVWELFRHTAILIIIAPHKRPFLEKIPGVNLMYTDYSLTPRGKKVYLRVYNQTDNFIKRLSIN